MQAWGHRRALRSSPKRVSQMGIKTLPGPLATALEQLLLAPRGGALPLVTAFPGPPSISAQTCGQAQSSLPRPGKGWTPQGWPRELGKAREPYLLRWMRSAGRAGAGNPSQVLA